MTSCTQCIDWATGCLWCSVPKDSPGFGRGVCLPRLQAQDSCEIGELQVRERLLVPVQYPLVLCVLLSSVVWNVAFISGNVCQPVHVLGVCLYDATPRFRAGADSERIRPAV